MSENCPTCGGPCTSKPVFVAPGIGREYVSLVQGEVVAEGWVGKFDLGEWPKGKQTWFMVTRERGTTTGRIPVLVIRAKEKEESMIQGGQR